ncbi:hypothetical protein PFISCL1PPCAC_11179, partial [Pristionchus fissidentatus]
KNSFLKHQHLRIRADILLQRTSNLLRGETSSHDDSKTADLHRYSARLYGRRRRGIEARENRYTRKEDNGVRGKPQHRLTICRH